ncbi:hypothetical protein ACN38_g9818 [Penicillium nordicum]|uniref:Uncharacterized protein n=1 Tax=Penicillium nordicum TaxID=229535 RepID=A0A0M8NV09_9EURO|nr:hypothetical protein ACN38_g9818 [Penicillium nordicum]
MECVFDSLLINIESGARWLDHVTPKLASKRSANFLTSDSLQIHFRFNSDSLLLNNNPMHGLLFATD